MGFLLRSSFAAFFCLFSASLCLGATVVSLGNGTLVLRGESCDSLQTQWKDFCSWKTKLEPGAALGTFECKKLDSQYEASLLNCVPNKVLRIHGQAPSQDGPNCWGTALFLSQIRSSPLESSDYEFEFWMQSPLCKKIAANETGQPGDIVRVRAGGEEGPEFTENHGFTRISDTLCFSKNGNKKDSKYLIQSCADVYSLYGVDQKCKQLDSDQTAKDQGCKSYSQNYRCESFNSFVSKQTGVDADTLELIQKINEIESTLGEMLFQEISDKNKEVLKQQELGIQATLAILQQESQELVERKTKKKLGYFQPGDVVKAIGTASFSNGEIVTLGLYLRYQEMWEAVHKMLQ